MFQETSRLFEEMSIGHSLFTIPFSEATVDRLYQFPDVFRSVVPLLASHR
jgi:hypothetical protein